MRHLEFVEVNEISEVCHCVMFISLKSLYRYGANQVPKLDWVAN